MEHYYIGSLIKRGCKVRARRVFMNVLFRVNQVVNFNTYSEILFKVYEISAPLIGVNYFKKSGQRYSLPSSISSKRAESVVARWVIESAQKRSDGFCLEDKLVNEILDILAFKGITLSKREEFHKKVISNRFFMKNYFFKPKTKLISKFRVYARPPVKKIRKVRIT